MIFHLKESDLCFKKVVASKNQVFLTDEKDELWVYGKGFMG